MNRSQLPSPIGAVGPGYIRVTAFDMLALSVRSKIHSAGKVAVFMDSSGAVHALDEASADAQRMMRRWPHWLVGIYTVTATRQQIGADLRERHREAMRKGTKAA